MSNPNRNLRYAGVALAALLGLATLPEAGAVGTAANTTINNKATVGYTVGGVVQAPIESSPTGNSTPGVGNGVNTAFVVDNRVDLTVSEVSGAAEAVNPGQANVVAAMRVSNTGNAAQAYQLTAANVAGSVFGNADNADVTNLRVFVDANANGTYEPATDTATSVATLAADANVVVFVVADVPPTATNAQFANVRLTATTAVNNTPATVLTQTAGADTPGAVDIVFADSAGAGDAARDGRHAADDQFAVQSAVLSITKTSTLISDPVNGTTTPKAIPGARVEYVLTIANTGTRAATGITIADPLPASTAFVQNVYNGAASDVSVVNGAATAFCVAEAGGTDSNGDGCVRTAGGALQVTAPVMPASVPASGPNATVVVRFQVTIN
jgi:uncharacterized repeat protein (TIGR01451 family)